MGFNNLIYYLIHKMVIQNKKPRRCKDGTLDMRCRENFGHDKFEKNERLRE
jgi:hypothetical protein